MKVKGSIKPDLFLADANPRDKNTVILWFRENPKEFTEENEGGTKTTGYEYDEWKIVAPKNYADIFSNDEWKALAQANEKTEVPTIEDRLVAAEQAITDMMLM